jgi:putative NIF3 family GTP cyclohydrolase 1 type 2
MRVVGNPEMKLTKIGFLPGASGAAKQIMMLERDDVEALLIGEAPEWETISYARDAVTEGKHKALIILGHTVSEEAGMRYCAQWLTTFIPETPIEFIPAGEPFWTP